MEDNKYSLNFHSKDGNWYHTLSEKVEADARYEQNTAILNELRIQNGKEPIYKSDEEKELDQYANLLVAGVCIVIFVILFIFFKC